MTFASRTSARRSTSRFAFDAITVQPNTVDAHRLMYFGTRNGREDETAEALFRAYFIDGKVLTDRAVLADIVGEVGSIATRSKLSRVRRGP